MTLDELLVVVTDRRIIRHHFKTFFLVYDAEEMLRFKELGASIRPAGGGSLSQTPGKPEFGKNCWEVYLRNMLDPMIEVIDGEEVDVREEFLLNYFRDRDGYEVSVLAPAGSRD